MSTIGINTPRGSVLSRLSELVLSPTGQFLKFARRMTRPAGTLSPGALLLDCGGAISLLALMIQLDREENFFSKFELAYTDILISTILVGIWIWLKLLFIVLKIRDRPLRESISVTPMKAGEFLRWVLAPAFVVPIVFHAVVLGICSSYVYNYHMRMEPAGFAPIDYSVSACMVAPCSMLTTCAILFLLFSNLCIFYPRTFWSVCLAALMELFPMVLIVLWNVFEVFAFHLSLGVGNRYIISADSDQIRLNGAIVFLQDVVYVGSFLVILAVFLCIAIVAWRRACKSFIILE